MVEVLTDRSSLWRHQDPLSIAEEIAYHFVGVSDMWEQDSQTGNCNQREGYSIVEYTVWVMMVGEKILLHI